PALVACATFVVTAAAQQTATFQQENGEKITHEQLQTTGATDTGSALNLYRPDLFSSIDGATLIHGLPVMTLLDGRRFPISGELGRMGTAPLNLFPLALISAVQVQKTTTRPSVGSDAPGGVVDLELKRGYTTGGEVGVFYGKSGGRNGREDFEAHIIGTVGNDKVQITAGAAYQESSGRYGSYRGYSR
ncbi:MAG: TonB-dependent receptor plug domain-containing protein, partial [Verrucomicrobiota bacterium]|nr:TonB-dependent receptor plug domain-containing protein [Verrucomicrobiota bacterium]